MAKQHNPILKAYGYVLPKWQKKALLLERGDKGHIFVTFILAIPVGTPIVDRPIPTNKGKYFLITIFGNKAEKFFKEIKVKDFIRISCDVTQAEWYFDESKQYQNNKGVNFICFRYKKVEPETCRKSQKYSKAEVIAEQEYEEGGGEEDEI